jgi:hypothetical protein
VSQPRGCQHLLLLELNRKAMRDFSLGFAKFSTPPAPGPVSEAPPHHWSYGRTAAISRLRSVQDGLDNWQQTPLHHLWHPIQAVQGSRAYRRISPNRLPGAVPMDTCLRDNH